MFLNTPFARSRATTLPLVLAVWGSTTRGAVTAASAQTVARPARIGLLSPVGPTEYAAAADAFRQGLRDRGYIDGKNITIEYRWAAGKSERLPGFAAELVRLKVDVIVAHGLVAALAAKEAHYDPHCHRVDLRSRPVGTRIESCAAPAAMSPVWPIPNRSMS